MKYETAIEVLTAFNAWRRGADIPQPDPREAGQAIDVVIDALKNILQCHCEAVHLPHKKLKK